MRDLPKALESLQDALTSAERLVGLDDLAPLRYSIDRTSERVKFLGETVVIALIGGTGSGKSTLLNALAGAEVTAASVLRPTTQHPSAWIPRSAEPEVLRLLETFGIDRVTRHDDDDPLAIIDMPDLDSVELAHRATVDALLPRIDVVVWVTDPQKYNDRPIHDRIAARAAYADQFVFVMNRMDALRDQDRAEVLADLRGSLNDDGIAAPKIFATAAAPAEGPAQGITELRMELRERAGDKASAIAKIGQDVRAAADALRELAYGEQTDAPNFGGWANVSTVAAERAAHILIDDVTVAASQSAGARVAVHSGSGPLGRVWHFVRRGPAGRILGLPLDEPPSEASRFDGTTRAAADEAATTLSQLVVRISQGLGQHAGRRLRAELPHTDVSEHTRVAIEAARSGAEPVARLRRGWWPGAALMQTLITFAVGAGAIWWWTDPSSVRPGSWPWPLILILGSLALGFGVRTLLRRSGRTAGRAQALERRRLLSKAIGRQFDRRLGQPLREIEQARDELRDALWRAESAAN